MNSLLHNPFILEHPHEITDVQWLIVRLIGLVLLVWITVKFILPAQIKPHLVSRREDIQTADNQVEETIRETALMRDDYRVRLEKIEDETEARMAEAVREADDLRNHIITEAKQMAEAIVRRGEDEVSRERAKSMVGLRRQFVEDVINAAEHAAGKLDAPNQKRLFDLFVSNVGDKSAAGAKS